MANPNNPESRGQGTAASAAQTAKEAAANLGHKAQDTASNLAQKARDTAGDLGHKAQERAGDALGAVGQGMSSLAGSIRQNVPREGMLGSAAGSVAEGLESGGRYLREHDVNEIGEDIGRLVRQHPLPALLTVFGIGFVLGSALRR